MHDAHLQRHRFDQVSAALGVLTVLAGIAVIAGVLPDFSTGDTGTWLALGALVVGLALIPWRRPTRDARRWRDGER